MLIEKENVKSLPSYSVSKTIEEVCIEYGLNQVVYLASNENPFGCSEAVMEVIRSANNLHRYPDGDGRLLKVALSQHLSCHSENIFLGNGSNEVLECAAKAFVSDHDEVLISEHSFAMYPILGKLCGGDIVHVPAQDWQVDLPAMASAVSVKTRLIYLSNINNPTGLRLDYDAFIRFMTKVPSDVLIVVDEAYIEFSNPENTLLSEAFNYPNLLISRAFSKAYGLAGFRVGYGVANKRLISILEKVKQPFNLNTLALKAAVAAIEDQAFVRNTAKHTQQQRELLQRNLLELGFQVLKSDANFLCYCAGDGADEHYRYLLEKGVIIRPLKSYGMADWLRVSIGTVAENQAFIEAVEQWKKDKNE